MIKIGKVILNTIRRVYGLFEGACFLAVFPLAAQATDAQGSMDTGSKVEAESGSRLDRFEYPISGLIVSGNSKPQEFVSSLNLVLQKELTDKEVVNIYPVGVSAGGMLVCFEDEGRWTGGYQQGRESVCLGFDLNRGDRKKWVLPADEAGAKRRDIIERLHDLSWEWREMNDLEIPQSKLGSFGEGFSELAAAGLEMTMVGVTSEFPVPNVLDIGVTGTLFHASNSFDDRYWVLLSNGEVTRLEMSSDFPGGVFLNNVGYEKSPESHVETTKIALGGCDSRGIWNGTSAGSELSNLPGETMRAYDESKGNTGVYYTLLRSVASTAESELILLYEVDVESIGPHAASYRPGEQTSERQLSVLVIGEEAEGATVSHRRIVPADFLLNESNVFSEKPFYGKHTYYFAWQWGTGIGIQILNTTLRWDLQTDKVSQIGLSLGRILGVLSNGDLLVVSGDGDSELEGLQIIRFE